VIAFVVGVGGIQGWRYYKHERNARASDVFVELQEAVKVGDGKRAADLAGKLKAEYAGTAYASKAALLAARLQFDSDDLKAAEANLRWAADNGDANTAALARLRLAAVLLDDARYDEALKVLAAPHPEPFAALFADARGDVLVAQGKSGDAAAAYQVALDKLPRSSTYRNVVEIKRDALGVPR
jgi:predicted negative regulator of RcsB-dependent stress response